MARDNVETEVKLYVRDLDAVKARIEAAGGELSAPRVYERNIRYDNDARELKAAGTVLRLRQDTRARLTFKEGERQLGAHGSSRFEAEVEVSDLEQMETILGKLGYHPVMVYEKYRTTYTLDDAEVTLDEMPYGNFVEIEADDDVIGRVLETLKLDGAHRMTGSYTVLFDRVRQKLGLSFTDLTFANFKEIDVLESAFEEA